MITHARLLVILPLALVVCAVGCNTRKTLPSTVSGSVKYKSKVVGGGTVMFHFKDGAPYSAPIKPDGTYLASQIPTGEAQVTVETESANTGRNDPTYGKGKGGAGAMSPTPGGRKSGPVGEYVKIPAKYGDKNKSGLTYTVVSGRQTKDWDLTD